MEEITVAPCHHDLVESSPIVPRPIFVIGSYRSGTSIFAWCLGQHPNIVNLPETYWLARLTTDMVNLFSLGTATGRFSHLGQLRIDMDEFYEMFGLSVHRFILDTSRILIQRTEAGAKGGEFRRRRSANDPKSRWLDATPENSHYVYALNKLFPEARFIHLLRNPHDVARSLMHFSRVGGQDQGVLQAYGNWTRLVRAAVAAERAFGGSKVLRVLYDDLINQQEATMHRCLAFVDEEYNADCLRPLSRKINSSKIDENVADEKSASARHSASAAEADDLYRQLTAEEAANHAPDQRRLEALANDFHSYVSGVRQSSVCSIGHERVAPLQRLRHLWLRARDRR